MKNYFNISNCIISQALVSWIHPEEYSHPVPTTPSIVNTNTSASPIATSSPTREDNISYLLPTDYSCIDYNLSYMPTNNLSSSPTNYSLLDCDNTTCSNIDPTPTINNVSLALLLYLFCFATVIGNALVIMAVYQVILVIHKFYHI